jgi:MFS transporter, NNP family, nitrate/nitrite transporter
MRVNMLLVNMFLSPPCFTSGRPPDNVRCRRQMCTAHARGAQTAVSLLASSPTPPPNPAASSPSLQTPSRTTGSQHSAASAKIQVAVLLFGGMITTMALSMVNPLFPAYAEELGLSSRGLGLIIALPSIAKVILNLPMGVLVDRGRRLPLAAGIFVQGAGSLATAAARTLPAMFPARLLVGAGSAAANTAYSAYTMDVADKYPAHRGFLQGTMQSAIAIAFAAGPAAGGLIAANTGSSRFPFVLMGLTLLLSAPLYGFLLPETVDTASAAPAVKALTKAATSQGGEPSSMHQMLRNYAQLIIQKQHQGLLALNFGMAIGWSAWLTVLPMQAAAAWGASAADLGKMYSVVALFGFISAPIGGYLSDRLGSRPVMTVGALLSAFAIGSLPFAATRGSFYALMALWDVAEAMLSAAMSSFAADITPVDLRGTQTSLLSQIQDLVFAVMPIALGCIAAAISNAAALRAACGFMLMSCALAAHLLRSG